MECLILFVVALFFDVVGVCKYMGKLEKLVVLLFFKHGFKMFFHSEFERNAHYKERSKLLVSNIHS